MDFANFFVALVGIGVGLQYPTEKNESLKAIWLMSSLGLLIGSFFITDTTDLTKIGLAFGLVEGLAVALVFGLYDFLIKLVG